jgi:hypothetical protein
VLKLIEKRARTSGILKRVCCHSFRATGVTEYMNSGGTIEIAQQIAGHTVRPLLEFMIDQEIG